MKKFLAVALLVLFCSFFLISAASAEITYTYGASERIRQEVWDNLLDLKTLPRGNNTNYDRNFFRFKTSLWGSVDFDKDTGVFLKLTSEVYYNLGPYKQPSGPQTSPDKFTQLDENEGVIDNLYFKANNVFGLPVDLKIGRQDFLGPDMYGEGFLFRDGNPNDGSRCFYFNAAKAKWRINEDHNVDFVYITNQFEDRYLPSLRTAVPNAGTYYNNKKILNASDEQGFVVYGRDKLSENLNVEPYYIFKREEKHPLGPPTPELDLNTIGARAVYTSGPWTFGGEFAHQFGEYDGGRDRSAYGGYIFGKRKFADMPLKPEFELRFVSLSGDDPNTEKNENWDPLFAKAPYWNELLIYVQIYEFIPETYAMPGYWSNLQLYMAKATMELTPDTKLALSYQYWRANQDAQPLAPHAAMFGDGHDRGHLPTMFLTHKFNKNIDAFFQYEYFIPGDFYADSAKNGQFLRWQLQFKI
ncbi:MAG: alginate export family protein [Thermodesulfovibrionales bacterium]|nr:alginate export family protein [Thermodesulfovibrionales bacterium]